jgi:hypothetical protein
MRFIEPAVLYRQLWLLVSSHRIFLNSLKSGSLLCVQDGIVCRHFLRLICAELLRVLARQFAQRTWFLSALGFGAIRFHKAKQWSWICPSLTKQRSMISPYPRPRMIPRSPLETSLPVIALRGNTFSTSPASCLVCPSGCLSWSVSRCGLRSLPLGLFFFSRNASATEEDAS